MSKGTKIGCAIVAALFVLASVVCAGGVYFASEWVDDVRTDYDERRPQLKAEAAAVAAGGAEACISDGLQRDSGCTQFEVMCHADATVRTNMCLDIAKLPAGFCDGVPGSTEILDVSMWALAECARRGRAENDNCGQFLAKTMAKRCDGP